MLVRREVAADVPAVRTLIAAAFATMGDNADRGIAVEVPLLDALRECDGWIPELSLVAVDAQDRPLGYVVCTRGQVARTPALGLGPIGVHPDHQNAGVGSALMHAVVAAAEARDEPLIALLGEPAYYSRFGFRPSTDHHVIPPEAAWGAYFQTRPLAAHNPSLRGEFSYAQPFQEL